MARNIVTDLLCEGTWAWDPDGRCRVFFKEDGTGALFCGVEMDSAIACEIDWQLHTKASDIATNLPAEIVISVTLTKRRPEDDLDGVPQFILASAAYQQKKFHLRLEERNFEVEHRTTYGRTPTYKYRLLWDKSPYPPKEEWNYPEVAEQYEYYDHNDFYKEELKATK